MDCLFLEPFLYLYYQLPIVADRSGPIPTNVWPPPPPVDILFNRQRNEFLSKRVFYPWGGQIPRYATDLGNVIYEQDCLPLWVPKPKLNMYHVLESFQNLAEQTAPLPSIHPPSHDGDDSLNISKEQNTNDEILGYCHIGTQLAEDLMDEIATLPDLSMSTDGQFAFFADHSRFGKALDIQPFVRGWLGNGTAPGLSPWSPCYTDSNNLLLDGALDSLVESSDPDLASTPTSPDMNDTLLTSSITSTTTASTNLMTPRSEVDLFADAVQGAKASSPSPDRQYPGQDDSDGESDELIVVPRLWNLSVLDLTGDAPRRSPFPWSSPPNLHRAFEDHAERVHSPVQSILNWRDGTTNSLYVASSANVTCIASEGTIVPCAVGSSPIGHSTVADDHITPLQPETEEPDLTSKEIDYEHPTDEEPRTENYEVIVPEPSVVHVDEPTSRWLYGILREQEDDEEADVASAPSSTSSLGSELSSHCQLRLGPRAAPLWGPPPNVESTKGSHFSLPTHTQDMDDSLYPFSSNTQRRLSSSRPPSTMHEEILVWIIPPEAVALPNPRCTEPDLPSLPSQRRKPSLFRRLLSKIKRGPMAVRRLLPSPKWFSVSFKLPARGRTKH